MQWYKWDKTSVNALIAFRNVSPRALAIDMGLKRTETIYQWVNGSTDVSPKYRKLLTLYADRVGFPYTTYFDSTTGRKKP